MNFSEKIAFSGWILTALVLLYQMHRNRILDARANKAENQIAQNRRRGDSPYLAPYSEGIGSVYEQENDKTFAWHVMSSNVLSLYRNKVGDIKDGDSVVLVLNNNGEPARCITIKSDLKECVLRQEPELDGANGLIILKYAYESEKLGDIFTVCISFESISGFKDTHTYRTIHGMREFVRIDPS